MPFETHTHFILERKWIEHIGVDELARKATHTHTFIVKLKNIPYEVGTQSAKKLGESTFSYKGESG